MNIVGNVLGKSGYHTNYERNYPSGSGSGDVSIYVLGKDASNTPTDAKTKTTLMRWGNYDVVTGAARFQASEVPSGLSVRNPVPATQSLPSSFYLSAKPAWWGARPWPPIGPDVTGGELANGVAYRIPARLCYENTSKTGSILNFNADNCYAAGTGTALPAAPLTSRSLR